MVDTEIESTWGSGALKMSGGMMKELSTTLITEPFDIPSAMLHTETLILAI